MQGQNNPKAMIIQSGPNARIQKNEMHLVPLLMSFKIYNPTPENSSVFGRIIPDSKFQEENRVGETGLSFLFFHTQRGWLLTLSKNTSQGCGLGSGSS